MHSIPWPRKRYENTSLVASTLIFLQVLDSSGPQCRSYVMESAAHTISWRWPRVRTRSSETSAGPTLAALSRGHVWNRLFFFSKRVALSPNHDDIYQSHKPPPTPPHSHPAFPWLAESLFACFPLICGSLNQRCDATPSKNCGPAPAALTQSACAPSLCTSMLSTCTHPI